MVLIVLFHTPTSFSMYVMRPTAKEIMPLQLPMSQPDRCPKSEHEQEAQQSACPRTGRGPKGLDDERMSAMGQIQYNTVWKRYEGMSIDAIAVKTGHHLKTPQDIVFFRIIKGNIVRCITSELIPLLQFIGRNGQETATGIRVLSLWQFVFIMLHQI